MKISEELHRLKKATFKSLQDERRPWWAYWGTLAEYYLPTRYRRLESPTESQSNANNRNSMILDATGTMAARILAAGMMNGITSPARPWFKLRLVGFEEDEISHAARMWLDECERRMLKVFSESNFYTSLSTLYLDLGIFGTSSMILYEDPEKVIHCENPMLGEFYLMVDARHRVCGFARDFTYTVYQAVREFGLDNVSDTVREDFKSGGDKLQRKLTIVHLIEPNDERAGALSESFAYREYYWEATAPLGTILRERGYYEFPIVCPRWELSGNDAYGNSPAMDALGDVIQLQHETKKKAQMLDKQASPPMLVDVTLKHEPFAMLPNGVTYVSRLGEANGARPAFQVDTPLQEITLDIIDVRRRIKDHFHNSLFDRVMTLETVRSATEINAIDSEKLVLLGPVLNRFNSEGLDPAVERTFAIMSRKGLLPDAPPELRNVELKIQYVSIFAAAQNAVSTAPVERLLGFIGNMVEVFPEAALVPDIPVLLTDYARDIGVKARGTRSIKEITRQINQRNEAAMEDKAVQDAGAGAAGAKLLSETEVGGGRNALQAMLESVSA